MDFSMKRRILIVDDDRDHAESIADLVAMRGHDVEIAGSGEAGIAHFRENVFDLVLMDVKMPGMNGVDAFFELRKLRPDACVMMMTGFSVEQLVDRAVANGAIGTLRKPLAIPQLLQAIETLSLAP
jgi:DNA-binding response OmpR family regulator